MEEEKRIGMEGFEGVKRSKTRFGFGREGVASPPHDMRGSDAKLQGSYESGSDNTTRQTSNRNIH